MVDPNNGVLRIHQTLHGYSDGHQLLATSISLPRETERNMLIISDMSGSSMVTGFESYLTGYPVLDAGFYAIARTWHAPEMSRPGCVWTHTLLISYADMAQIQNFNFIPNLFLRPNENLKFDSYEIPLEIDSESTGKLKNDDSFDYPEFIVKQILISLYGVQDKPVFVATDRGAEFDHLAMAILSQQWPRLRRTFYFCTGALANRKMDQQVFHFQVIPSKILSSLKKKVQGSFVETANKEVAVDDHVLRWVVSAYNDLFAPRMTELRKFLWNFGADASAERMIFSYLTTIFVLLKSVNNKEASLSSLVKTLSEFFPKSHEAGRLKKNILLGQSANTVPPVLMLPECELLNELVTTSHYKAFDAEELNITGRAIKLWESDSEKAKLIIPELFKTEPNTFAEHCLRGISLAITPHELLDISRENIRYLFGFVYFNLHLAESSLIWNQPVDIQRELFTMIFHQDKPLDENLRDKVIISIFDAGIDAIADDVISFLGESAIITILNRFNESDDHVLENFSVTLADILKSKPETLLNWLSSQQSPAPSSLALMTNLLNPHSPIVREFGTDLWLPLVNIDLTFLSHRTLIKTMVFLLALGFYNVDSGSYELVEASFKIVYKAAKQRQLPDESWRLLNWQLPYPAVLGWFYSEQKLRCKRLKSGLQKRIYSYQWPEHILNRLH